MEQYGYHKPLSLLEKLEKLEGVKEPEKNDAYWNKLRRTQLRLIALLNRKDFEPLWREIYRAFTTAQTDYPTYAEGETPLEPLKKRAVRSRNCFMPAATPEATLIFIKRVPSAACAIAGRRNMEWTM